MVAGNKPHLQGYLPVEMVDCQDFFMDIELSTIRSDQIIVLFCLCNTIYGISVTLNLEGSATFEQLVGALSITFV